MSVVPVDSNLGDVAMKVTGISKLIERRTSTVTYERSKSNVFSTSRGTSGIRVRAQIRDEDDLDILDALFGESGPQTAFFDARQRTRYTGDYVLGDLEYDDETHSTTNISVNFSLFELPDGLNMASLFDTLSASAKPYKEGNFSWRAGTIAPAASARGNLASNTASAQNVAAVFNAHSTSATDPTTDTTTFTTGDKVEVVEWLTATGFSDLSADQLMGFRLGDSTAVLDKTTTAQHNIAVGADSTGALYLVTSDGSTVNPQAIGVTVVSGTRFKMRLTATVGTSVVVIINDATQKTSSTSLPTRFNTAHIGWGTSGTASKSVLVQGDMYRYTAVS